MTLNGQLKSKPFFIGLAVAALSLTLLVVKLSRKDPKLFGRLSVRSAISLRRFLGVRVGDHGQKRSINPWKDPALMASLFPGYDFSGDENLWRNYFSRDFDVKVTSAYLSQSSKRGQGGQAVYHSWTGCLDIIRRHGVDILLMGASDMAQNIPPDELAGYFPGRKILMCAAPTLTLDAMRGFLFLAKDLYPAHLPKPQVVVIGASRSLAFISSIYYRALDQHKQAQLEQYERRDLLKSYAYLNQPFLFPWTWNEIFPVKRDPQHLPLPNRLNHPERWSILAVQMTPEDLEHHPEEFQRLRDANIQPSTLLTAADEDPTCARLIRLPVLLRQLTDDALAFADQALIYAAPSMGDELREAPPCYLDLLASSIDSLKSDRVSVFPVKEDVFQLTAWDFAFFEWSRTRDLLSFDVAHPNYDGAKKITAVVAQRLKEIQIKSQ